MSSYRLAWALLSIFFLLFSSHHHQPLAESGGLDPSSSKATTHQAQAFNFIRQQHERDSANQIYLESMDDLEHVSYLSMRNFNMTDESLLQSSWLINAGNTLVHKQHQKVASSSTLEAGADGDVTKSRLALMLESFISHLRNGHLRRLELAELEAIVRNFNQSTEPPVDGPTWPPPGEGLGPPDRGGPEPAGRPQTATAEPNIGGQDSTSAPSANITKSADSPGVPADRCHYLVAIYRVELEQRQRRQRREQREGPQQQQPSLSGQASLSSRMAADYSDQASQAIERESSQQDAAASSGPTGSHLELPDSSRLMQLCRLAVECQTAEDLVNLIARGSWRQRNDPSRKQFHRPEAAAHEGSGTRSESHEQTPKARGRRRSPPLAALDEQEQLALDSGASLEGQEKVVAERPGRPKSLRDSLSLSLAKLCPLILFQLHDDEGMCTVRRDDRPPMITVWGFATLFVTIVSFCSLIGLSITPLLGPTGAPPDSSSSSPSSSSATDLSGPGYALQEPCEGSPEGRKLARPPLVAPPVWPAQVAPAHDHRNTACLTLFEGLAVGSLVGSALFSLIPQAFELQERESNQGFLLKALIIFFGIYLFFCSERLMRIIVDTRQRRKKGLNHRSSNSIPLPSTTADFDHTQQQQQQQLLHLQKQSAYSAPIERCSSGPKRNRSSRPDPVGQAATVARPTQLQLQVQSQHQHQVALNGRKDKSELSGSFSSNMRQRTCRLSPTRLATEAGAGGAPGGSASATTCRGGGVCSPSKLSAARSKRQRSLENDRRLAQGNRRQHRASAQVAPITTTGSVSHQHIKISSNSGRLSNGVDSGPFEQQQPVVANTLDPMEQPACDAALSRVVNFSQLKGDESVKLNRFNENKTITAATGSTGAVAPTPLGSPIDRPKSSSAPLSSTTTTTAPNTTTTMGGSSRRSIHHRHHHHQRQQEQHHGNASSILRNRTRRRKTRHQLQAAKRQRRQRLKQLPRRHANESDDDQHQHGSSSSSSISALSATYLAGAKRDGQMGKATDLHDEEDSLADLETCAYMSASNDEEFGEFNETISDEDELQQMRAVNQQMRNYTSSKLSSVSSVRQQQKQQQHHHHHHHHQQRLHFNQHHQSYSGQFNEPHRHRSHHQRAPAADAAPMQNRRTSFHIEAPAHAGPYIDRLPLAMMEQDISTVAWMIILGDGLHNFIDGISIGAAFSESILSGVSISVAVICEEFPHELGDFAVLVSSGMTVHQALGYNFLSACTCYLGMAVGIILGDVNDGASYISALAAGVFLYIALVDMMGELSATLEETSRDSIAKTLKLLLLQNVGIFIGISIIFILSFIDF